MSYRLVFTESYSKRAAKWLKRHPDLRQQYLKTLQLLELNPFHPSLRLHALSGRLQGIHAVSLNLIIGFLVFAVSLLKQNTKSKDQLEIIKVSSDLKYRSNEEKYSG